jgi:YVTN family beta-propeller protein
MGEPHPFEFEVKLQYSYQRPRPVKSPLDRFPDRNRVPGGVLAGQNAPVVPDPALRNNVTDPFWRNAMARWFALALLLLSPVAALAGPGELIVLNKSGASASILDLASGEELARLEVGVGPHEVAVSPDGRTAVVANYGDRSPGNTLSVLDLVARTVRSTIDLGENPRPHGIVYTDASTVLVTTEDSGKLLAVDVERGEVVQEMETGGRVGHMVAVSRDGKRAFVPHMYSDNVAVLDLESAERIELIGLGSQPEGIDARPGTEEIWITNRASNSVHVLDATTLEILARLDCGEFPIRLKFTPDGRYALVSNARSGDVVVFDADARSEIARIAMLAETVADKDQRLFGEQFGDSPTPVGIVVHPDGGRAYVANTNADVISVIDLESMELIDRLVAGEEPDGMAWAPGR